jgi:hypothetical protein
MQENPETGITEYRLFHMDRILFGSNTILVFKYPLMSRKLKLLRAQIGDKDASLTEDQIEQIARKTLIEEGLI